jgi:hypothetical protein
MMELQQSSALQPPSHKLFPAAERHFIQFEALKLVNKKSFTQQSLRRPASS